MQECEVLSALIGDIYDAALDADLWIPAISRVRKFVGGYSATIFSKDATRKDGNLFYEEGKIGPHYIQKYFKEYVKIDPFTTGQVFAEIGVPIAIQDVMSYDEFLNTRFYTEWVRPQGIVDFASTVLDRSANTAALFGVFRHEQDGLVDDEMRRKLRLVAPHLRRAVLVGRSLELTNASAAMFADTLDGLSAGIFLVDDNRMIVHANASGRSMLASGEVVNAVGGRLAASDPTAHHALRAVLEAAGKGDFAVGNAAIGQPLGARNGERYVAHVLSLMSGARRQAGKNHRAVAILFVHKAQLQLAWAPEAIAKTFNLTPAELRVLFAIVHVGGVPETSEVLGVTENTVKTHLQRVFDKTGTGRQADLVSIVSTFSSPFANSSQNYSKIERFEAGV